MGGSVAVDRRRRLALRQTVPTSPKKGMLASATSAVAVARRAPPRSELSRFVLDPDREARVWLRARSTACAADSCACSGRRPTRPPHAHGIPRDLSRREPAPARSAGREERDDEEQRRQAGRPARSRRAATSPCPSSWPCIRRVPAGSRHRLRDRVARTTKQARVDLDCREEKREREDVRRLALDVDGHFTGACSDDCRPGAPLRSRLRR